MKHSIFNETFDLRISFRVDPLYDLCGNSHRLFQPVHN